MKVQKGQIEVLFKAHAIFRASDRGIPWELIENTIQRGSFEKFGNRMVRISKRCGIGKLALIGKQFDEDKIIIITIEWRR